MYSFTQTFMRAFVSHKHFLMNFHASSYFTWSFIFMRSFNFTKLWEVKTPAGKPSCLASLRQIWLLVGIKSAGEQWMSWRDSLSETGDVPWEPSWTFLTLGELRGAPKATIFSWTKGKMDVLPGKSSESERGCPMKPQCCPMKPQCCPMKPHLHISW